MATKVNDGGPAFPSTAVDNQGRIDYADEMGYGGMSLRDYFAGQALAGLNASPVTSDWCSERLATQAYDDADAMLAERATGEA